MFPHTFAAIGIILVTIWIPALYVNPEEQSFSINAPCISYMDERFPIENINSGVAGYEDGVCKYEFELNI